MPATKIKFKMYSLYLVSLRISLYFTDFPTYRTVFNINIIGNLTATILWKKMKWNLIWLQLLDR